MLEVIPDLASPNLQDWVDNLGQLDRRTWETMAAYMDVYEKCGSISKSALHAGISRETARRWENDDKFGFRQRQRDAQLSYADYLEGLALKRVESPKGNRGGDTLLIALNNANNPDKWRGNNVTVEVSDQVMEALKLAKERDSLALVDESKVIEHVSGDKAPFVD